MNKSTTTTHFLTNSEQEINCPSFYVLATNNGTQTAVLSKEADIASQSEEDVTAVEKGMSDYTATDAIAERIYAVGEGEVELEHMDDECKCFAKAVRKNFKTIKDSVSSFNILLNPDMAINQRGQAEYTAEGYAADRWYLSAKSSGTAYNFNTDGNTLTLVTSGHFVILRQFIENPSRLSESTVTFSVKLNSVPDCTWNIQIWRKTESGGSEIVGRADTNTDLAQLTITLPVIAAGEQLMCVIGLTTANSPLSIKYAKLEQGKTATNYAPVDPATEIAKCQRYYQIRSSGDIAAVDLRPTMRTTPTVTQLSDGNYAYNAEIIP